MGLFVSGGLLRYGRGFIITFGTIRKGIKMKDLELSGVTICLPDSDGDVEIESGLWEEFFRCYVPFETLEEWVISVREHMAKQNNDGGL